MTPPRRRGLLLDLSLEAGLEGLEALLGLRPRLRFGLLADLGLLLAQAHLELGPGALLGLVAGPLRRPRRPPAGAAPPRPRFSSRPARGRASRPRGPGARSASRGGVPPARARAPPRPGARPRRARARRPPTPPRPPVPRRPAASPRPGEALGSCLLHGLPDRVLQPVRPPPLDLLRGGSKLLLGLGAKLLARLLELAARTQRPPPRGAVRLLLGLGDPASRLSLHSPRPLDGLAAHLDGLPRMRDRLRASVLRLGGALLGGLDRVSASWSSARRRRTSAASVATLSARAAATASVTSSAASRASAAAAAVDSSVFMGVTARRRGVPAAPSPGSAVKRSPGPSVVSGIDALRRRPGGADRPDAARVTACADRRAVIPGVWAAPCPTDACRPRFAR